MLILRKPWDSQPQEAATLNPDFAPAFGWLGSNPTVELLKGSQLARVDGTTDAGVGGLGRSLQDSNTRRILIPDAVSPGSNFIAVVAFENLAASTSGMLLAGKTHWSQGNGFYFRSITNVNTLEITGSSSFPTMTATGVGAADGQLKVLVMEYAGTTVRGWLNGTYCGSVTIGAAGTWPEGIGIGNYSGTANNHAIPNRRFYGAAIVTSGDPQQLSLNPWQLFAPRSIWIPVSAGGAPTFNPAWARNSNTILVGGRL